MSLLNLFQIDERKATGSDGGREWREQSYAWHKLCLARRMKTKVTARSFAEGKENSIICPLSLFTLHFSPYTSLLLFFKTSAHLHISLNTL